MDIQYVKDLINNLEDVHGSTQTVDRDQLKYDVVIDDSLSKANLKLKDSIGKYKDILLVLENRERTNTYKSRLKLLFDGVGVYEATVTTSRARALSEEYKQDSTLDLLAPDKDLDVTMRDLLITVQEKIMRQLEPKDFLDDTDIEIIADPSVASKNEKFRQKAEQFATEAASQVCEGAQAYTEKLASEMSDQGLDVEIEDVDFSITNPSYDKKMTQLRYSITTAEGEERDVLERKREDLINNGESRITLTDLCTRLLSLRELLMSPSDIATVDTDLAIIENLQKVVASVRDLSVQESIDITTNAMDVIMRRGIFVDYEKV